MFIGGLVISVPSLVNNARLIQKLCRGGPESFILLNNKLK